jgi:hypothetical protein
MTPHGPTLVAHYTAVPEYSLHLPANVPPVFTTSKSLFYLLEMDMVLAKLIKPKRFPKDYVRRFVRQAEARRIFCGAQRLRAIGLCAPRPLGFALIMNPCSPYESIYYAEYKTSCMPLAQYISAAPPQERATMLELAARDYAVMINHGLHFKDLHWRNVMVDAEKRLCWVDTDMRSPTSTADLTRKIRREMRKLKQRSMRLLTEPEWTIFQTTVAANVRTIRLPLL